MCIFLRFQRLESFSLRAASEGRDASNQAPKQPRENEKQAEPNESNAYNSGRVLDTTAKGDGEGNGSDGDETDAKTDDDQWAAIGRCCPARGHSRPDGPFRPVEQGRKATTAVVFLSWIGGAGGRLR